ncbi:MAG: hypothetical protein FWG20_00790 [Candidatus Cloacimonetes bacterium]|nr:hypothetical protein [Candidatus Cloacimonadota bacterium]
MTTIKKIVLALVIMLGITVMFATENNFADANFELGLDARTAGMGGVGVGFLDNVAATFLNPATLADVKRHEFNFSYRANMEYDRSYFSAAGGFELPLGYLALSWKYAGTDKIRGFDPEGNPRGDFDSSANNINLSYALKISNFNVGITPKLYMSNIDDDKTTGFGLDLGAVWHMNRYFNLGFVARELASDVDGDGLEMPRKLIPGIAVFPVPGLVVAADMVGTNDFKDTSLNLGAEYWLGVGQDDNMGSSITGIRVRENSTWSDIFARTQAGIRAGLNDGKFAAGFGLRYSMFEVNYAYQLTDKKSEDTLDGQDHHLMSLTLRF